VNHNNSNNNASFLSNKEASQIFMNGKVNGVNNNGGILNSVNLNMLPNVISSDTPGNYVYPLNINGRMASSTNAAVNGQLKVHGSILNGSSEPNLPKPKKQVTIVERIQKNREDDEIEESNPTISLLHKEHCPQNGDHVDGEMWLAAENNEEQMKTLLSIRERQIHRGEEQISKLQKDKRSLNHQIGLMKTEMVQMKSQQDDAEKFARKTQFFCLCNNRRILFF